jgi:predicted dehydrogenase
MAEAIRIGFLGCGYIGDFHAAMLADCGEGHVIDAVFDPDGERAVKFAEKWRGTRVAGVDEVIDRSDAVFVCTWTSEHAELVRRAAARRRHVFCEKPLAFDAAAAAEMAETVRAAGVVAAVGLILRTAPAMLALREMLADPASGRIMNIVFRDDQYIPTQGLYASDWRADRGRAGSGALLEHSIHDVDILEWLAGPIVRVAAEQQFCHGIDGIEDSVSAVLRFASGACATLSSIWHDVLSRPSQRRIEVFCENALYTLEGEFFGPLRWERSDEAGSLEGEALMQWLAARSIDVAWPEKRFLDAIRSGGLATPGFDDAVRAHRLVDAIYESAGRGGAVSVPPP